MGIGVEKWGKEETRGGSRAEGWNKPAVRGALRVGVEGVAGVWPRRPGACGFIEVDGKSKHR